MHAQWQPDIRRDQRAHTGKSFRGNTNHGIRLSVDLDIAPDKIASVTHSFPERVTCHYDWYVRVRPALLSIIKSAAHRLDSHEREKILRDQEGKTPSYIGIVTDSRDSKLVGGEIDKEIGTVIAQRAIFRVG